MPNKLSSRNLVSRPENMDETVPHMFLICERINNMALLKENKEINWPQKKKI